MYAYWPTENDKGGEVRRELLPYIPASYRRTSVFHTIGIMGKPLFFILLAKSFALHKSLLLSRPLFIP